jgi:hypothetical protein
MLELAGVIESCRNGSGRQGGTTMIDKQFPGDEIFDEALDELPPGVCPACMGLSPGIDIDGETVMHCRLCDDGKRKVTPEEAERWEREMAARHGR